MQIRIYYEDTDTGGIVYHANYLNFCERARSQAFFDRGITPELKEGHFVARKLEASYIKSAKLGDVIDVETKLVEMKAASFTLKQSIYKEGQKLFEMNIVLAHISFEGAVRKIDEKTKEFLLSLFERSEQI